MPSTLIIKPKKSLLELNLKELWEYKDLIFLLVKRDFVATYKQTILGPLWFILTPLMNVMIFFIIFNKIANISTNGIPPILFYLSGLTLWNYFASTLNSTANTFINNSNLFGKVYFPRIIIPISITLSSLISFTIQFLLLCAILFIYVIKGYNFHFSIFTLFLPLSLVLTAVLSLGIGIIISSITIKYRDLRYLMTFGVQLWMYVTPIIYPLSIIPEKYKWIILLNPMAPIIEAFKNGILGTVTPIDTFALLYSVFFTISALICGILLFNKVESTFMDSI